ncbi:hypothetical protein [Acanthopleuribacter pedis]
MGLAWDSLSLRIFGWKEDADGAGGPLAPNLRPGYGYPTRMAGRFLMGNRDAESENDPATDDAGLGIDPATGNAGLGFDPATGDAGLGIDPANGNAGLGIDPANGNAWLGIDPANGNAWLGIDPANPDGVAHRNAWTTNDLKREPAANNFWLHRRCYGFQPWANGCGTTICSGSPGVPVVQAAEGAGQTTTNRTEWINTIDKPTRFQWINTIDKPTKPNGSTTPTNRPNPMDRHHRQTGQIQWVDTIDKPTKPNGLTPPTNRPNPMDRHHRQTDQIQWIDTIDKPAKSNGSTPSTNRPNRMD